MLTFPYNFNIIKYEYNVKAGDTTTRYDEAMNVKLLLREICQFLEPSRELPTNYSETGTFIIFIVSSILLQ